MGAGRALLVKKKTSPRAPVFPNDHNEASKKKSDKRAVVAVRSNATPIPGQWKLFLDHRFAYNGDFDLAGSTLSVTWNEGIGTGAEQANFTVVPAPGALALLGLAGLAGRRRRNG